MKKHLLITCGFVIAFIGLSMMATAQRNGSRPAHSSVTRSSLNSYLYVDDDSSVSPIQTVITYKDKQLYNMRTEGDKIIELYVDNRKIPADSLYIYTPLLQRLLEQIKQDKIQAEKDRIQAGKDEVQAKIDEVQAMKDAEQAHRDAEQAHRDAEEAQVNSEQAKRDAEQAQINSVQAKRDAEQSAKDRFQAKRDAEQAAKDGEQAKRDAEQAMRDGEQAKRDAERAKLDAIQAEKDRAILKSLIGELVKENIIPDEKSLYSLMLNEFVFVINGKKQSEELLEKFKAKFITRPGYNISYHTDSR